MQVAEEMTGDHISDAPFTAQERKDMRRMKLAWERGNWLVRAARNWILYIGVLVGGFIAFKDYILSLLGRGG